MLNVKMKPAVREKKRPTLHEVIKRAQDRSSHTNFMNELHEMERRRNYRLQLAQVNDMLYGKLTPGMRESLRHRRVALEKKVKDHLSN